MCAKFPTMFLSSANKTIAEGMHMDDIIIHTSIPREGNVTTLVYSIAI